MGKFVLVFLLVGSLGFSQSPPDRVFWEYITTRYPQIADTQLRETWIWGWSGGGVFAWFQSTEDGINLRILDLVDDRELLSRVFEYQSMEELWNEESEALDRLEERFDISPTNFQPVMAPFTTLGHYYTIGFEYERDLSGLLINHYQVSLIATGLGQKVLTTYEEEPLVWAYPIAYLPSHLESRIAIFVLEFPWAFAGTGVPRFRVIGGHLKVGFSPQD